MSYSSLSQCKGNNFLSQEIRKQEAEILRKHDALKIGQISIYNVHEKEKTVLHNI